MHIKGFSKVDN